LMVAAAARALAGVRTVFVGVGQPNLACNLARYTVAPELELIYESGVYGAQPARQPLSIGDPTLVTGATSVVSMADLFGLYLQGGSTAQQLGIPGKGPQLVITDKALFDFANAEREMQLVSLYPGLTIEAISAEMGWKVRVAQSLTETPAPTVDELAMVRRLSSGGTSQRAGEA